MTTTNGIVHKKYADANVSESKRASSKNIEYAGSHDQRDCGQKKHTLMALLFHGLLLRRIGQLTAGHYCSQ